MSFIYENDLLLKVLLEVGDQSIQKTAQTGMLPDEKLAVVNAIPDYEIALKLLYNLQRDLGDPDAPTAGVPIGVEGSPNASVTANTAHFRTLGDFLTWAAQNKLTWKGKRFAWTQAEVDAKRDQADDPTQHAWVFTSLPYDRNNRDLDRQPNPTTAYADKDAVVAYLSALRDSPDAKKNKVLQFMLATLIGEANGYLRIAGEQPIQTHSSEQPAENLNPRMVIDVVPSVLSMENINEGIDNHPFQLTNPDNDNALTVGDLKDEGSFKAWLRNRKIKLTTPAKGKEPAKSIVVGATDSNGDPCLAVHILYKRALQLRNVAAGDDQTVQNYSKGVALYIMSVTTFGKTLSGKDGQPCAVLNPGTSATQQGVGAGVGGGIGAAKPATTQMLNDVVQYMPLDLNSVNLNEIDAFFRAYEKIIGNTGSSAETAVQELHAQFNTARQNLGKSLVASRYNFPLVGGADAVVKWLKDPSNSYSSFIQNLSEAVEAAFGAISLFYNSYVRQRSSEDRIIFSPEQKSIVEGQTPIYRANMRFINRWLSDAGRVQGFKK